MLPPVVHLGQAMAEEPAPDGPRWVSSTQPRAGHGASLEYRHWLLLQLFKCFLEISSVQ